MSVLSKLPIASQAIFYVLAAVIVLFSALVLRAQIGCLRGRPFENPDGTKDDWLEQKIFYGIAWADILVACPLAFVSVVLAFVLPRVGFFLMGMAAALFLWSNVMTTVTSLRFERPRISLQWIVVFPTGAVAGLAYIIWMLVHFEQLF